MIFANPASRLQGVVVSRTSRSILFKFFAESKGKAQFLNSKLDASL